MTLFAFAKNSAKGSLEPGANPVLAVGIAKMSKGIKANRSQGRFRYRKSLALGFLSKGIKSWA